ncbi:MAG TPA: preprotein translocase subunit SecG [Firmicutes bacterium]|nr:preprotein translocase subunit SecG [Bacillota bacterium]
MEELLMEIVLGVILLIAAVFLIISVLMQNGKAHNLSGTIAGGAETFFGKNKGSTMDKMLSKVTSIVAVVFCVIVVIMYVVQDDTDYSSIITPSTDTVAADTTDGTETSGTETDGTETDATETDAAETTAAQAEAETTSENAASAE